MKSNNTALGKTQAVDRNGLHKAAEKLISQWFKALSVQQRSVFDRHVPGGLEVSNLEYSTYQAGG